MRAPRRSHHLTCLLLGIIWTTLAGSAGAADFASELDGLADSELIIYEPEQQARLTVTIFTDVNCPSSRDLHAQLDDYLLWDIEVRYAALPVIDDAREKMEAVWCSDDRHAAVNRAMRGEAVTAETCDNPVADHLALAEELRLRATPAVITPGGQVRYGAISPADLLDLLEAEAAGDW